MADAKISQLPVATTPLAGTELVPVVQGGVTVQTTVGDVLTGAVPSGTANGVLYLNGSKVATSGSGLTFDGTNLGVGSSSPIFKIDARGASGVGFSYIETTTGNANRIQLGAGSGIGYINATAGSGSPSLQFQVADLEQMRLTSTGLGIGTTSPAQKLTVQGGLTVTGSAALPAAAGSSILLSYESPISRLYFGDGTGYSFAFSKRTASVTTDLMTLTDQGNLGLGVTPSAWGVIGPALQVKQASLVSESFDQLYLSANAFFDGSWKYMQSDIATQYYQASGAHVWRTAPSGTAGNAISFTQAMTLDASGNLLVGTTSGTRRLTLNDATTSYLGYQVAGSEKWVAGVDTSNRYILFDTTASLNRLMIDASGNLGLGVTPSAWGNAYKALQVSSGASYAGSSNAAFWYCNAYNDNTNWRYVTSTNASGYAQFSGAHAWFAAPSGTAGNAISFTQAMTLDASGNLGVGVTSISGFRVDILSTSTDAAVRARSSNSNEVLRVESAGTSLAQIRFINTSVNNIYISADGTALTFTTNAQERARIPAAGGMVVGTAALATTATDGFLYVPTCAGTPTGTPTTQTGTAPIVVDTTNNKLYFYSGGQWRDAGP